MEAVPDTFSSLFWGYTVMWACIVVYLFALIRRMSKIERRLYSQREKR